MILALNINWPIATVNLRHLEELMRGMYVRIKMGSELEVQIHNSIKFSNFCSNSVGKF